MVENSRVDILPQTKSEKNIPIILMRIIIALMIIIVVLVVSIIVMLPLKEKEPYIVEFKTAKENYVIVKKANEEVLSNKPLIHRELKGYVEARENINKIDEARRYAQIVRVKSSDDVYRNFYNSFEAKSALWDTEGFSRECEVTNISDVLYGVDKNKFISIVEYKIIDKYADGTSTKLNFKATIRYEFVDYKISKEDETLNPLGMHIIAYNISSIKGIKNEVF